MKASNAGVIARGSSEPTGCCVACLALAVLAPVLVLHALDRISAKWLWGTVALLLVATIVIDRLTRGPAKRAEDRDSMHHV